MLYLAEVQIQKGGVFGGSKAQLKLLACQRGEQNWSAVSEETIAADDASKFNEGTLVLVELNASKQIQRPPSEAARQLVSILQNFSRQYEKSKTQEEEIEQWKQSLTFQSQELNRREMELQALEEQLREMEGEFERLEAQRQEIEGARDEANRLSEEVQRNRQELEGAWEHLRGEMRRLEEQQAQFQQVSGKVLDDEQARYVQELLDRLSGAVAPTDSVREHLNQAFEKLDGQQSDLNERWQQLEGQRQEAQQLQAEVDRLNEDVGNRDRSLQESRASLEQARSDLSVLVNTLKLRQEYSQVLTLRLHNQEQLHQQLTRLAESVDKSSTTPKVDVEALERMPVEELQGLVQQLTQDLEKMQRFVKDQEEELAMQRQTIEEVQEKLNGAGGSDRQSLEAELADERDRYQMLNETIVGQLRNLREREEVLSQHQAVLGRRLGKPVGTGSESYVDVETILAQLQEQRQLTVEELQKLGQEIEQMRQNVEQAEGAIAERVREHESQSGEIAQLEQTLQEKRAIAAQLWGKVNVYQEMLQPLQDRLNDLRQKLEAAVGGLNQIQETRDFQLQAIANMRQVFASLTNNGQVAA